MNGGELILDNSILSAFQECDWFTDISHWQNGYSIYTSERIWVDEFTQNNKGVELPDWLGIHEVPLPVVPHRNRSLGEADYSLLYLAHGCPDPILITNDQQLKQTTEDERLKSMWGSKFLKQTFESCGISTQSYRSNLTKYFEDAFLPPSVESNLRSASKS